MFINKFASEAGDTKWDENVVLVLGDSRQELGEAIPTKITN